LWGKSLTDVLMPSDLLTPIYASAAMRAIVSDTARVQRMLDFEAALARAEAAVGVITASGAGEIVEACKAERYDIATLAEASAAPGNLAIPLVEALTFEVAKRSKAAAGFVHWGATSQDIIDTALVLELRAAIDALLVDLDAAVKGFTALAGRHRRTLGVARTLMQHALPMPFGLRLAGYGAALARSRERLIRLRRDALVLQFGGAAGTLAALGERGYAVSERLAALLDLQLPDAPWHSHRDRLAEVAAAFAILTGTCGKIARDVALLMQAEVGEAFEPAVPGRGGSSTLPHKRNPVGATIALSAATIAPNLVATILAAQVQEQERAVGGWQAEWMTFPTLALVTSGALQAVVDIAEGLEIDVERVRANLELSGGQIMAEAVSFALAEKIGKADAHRIVQDLSQRAMKERRTLKDMVLSDLRVKAQFSVTEVEKLFIPLTYQGSAQTFIDRLVVGSQRGARRPEPSRPLEPKLPAAPQLQTITEIGVAVADLPKYAPPPTPLHEEIRQEPPAAPVVASEPALSEAAPEMPPASEAEPPPAAARTDDMPTATGAATVAAALAPPPPPAPPPPDEDAPGALMDVLSRADAEAAEAEAKRKPT
jgi:3-carboxy-cis,cis-muconate cycloisomerase